MAEYHPPPGRIEANGVYLRRHQVGDATAIAAAVAESLAELRPWVPWADRSAAEPGAQRRRLEEVVPHWEQGTEYVYLVFRPGQDKVLGLVGLHRRVGPGALEIGYWLRTSETGRGTMTEAVRALANEALALPGVGPVELRCDEANQKSAPLPGVSASAWPALDKLTRRPRPTAGARWCGCSTSRYRPRRSTT